MEITVFRDSIFRRHEQEPGHPERPERIDAIYRALDSDRLAPYMVEGPPRDATETQLRAVHDPRYISAVAESASKERTSFDPDTSANQWSYAAAVRASGCAVAAVDAVLDTPRPRALVAARPPGHHAESDGAAGFCFFNHVMVAAEHARERGLERVFILDWDVHHGNGTFHSSYDRADIFYASLHQYPLYPGTGRLGEAGSGAGEGRTLTVPLPAGCTDDDYLYVMHETVVPAIRKHQPELLIISAGFDAHYSDPIGGMHLSSSTYGAFAALETEVADELCEGRIVYVTEGGYDLGALYESTWELCNVLTGTRAQTDPAAPPQESVRRLVTQVNRVHGDFE